MNRSLERRGSGQTPQKKKSHTTKTTHLHRITSKNGREGGMEGNNVN